MSHSFFLEGAKEGGWGPLVGIKSPEVRRGCGDGAAPLQYILYNFLIDLAAFVHKSCYYYIPFLSTPASGQGTIRAALLARVPVIHGTGAPPGMLDVLARREALALQNMVRDHRALLLVVVVRILDVIDAQVEKHSHAYDVEEQDPARFRDERYLDAVEPEANGLAGTQDSPENSYVVGEFLGRVGERADPVVNDVVPQLREDPREHEENEDPAELRFVPVRGIEGWVVAVVVAHTDHLPDPCDEKPRADACQADQTALAAAPVRVVEDGLEGPACGDLQHHGHESEERSGAQVVVES